MHNMINIVMANGTLILPVSLLNISSILYSEVNKKYQITTI